MSISQNLKKLADLLQEEADTVLAEAEHDPKLFELVTLIVAGSVARLEKAAEEIEDIEPKVTPEALETVALLASALDDSDDEQLRKSASLLDDLLVGICAPKNAVAQAKASTEDEINRLREEYRAKAIEKTYKEPKEGLDKMYKKEDIQKAVKEQVKEYRPLESSLQTRYCPDHPGVSVSRVADYIYQCSLDKKIYDWTTGFTTEKGNKVPGGGVEHQHDFWYNRDGGHSIFDSRESALSRFAASFDDGPVGKIVNIKFAADVSEKDRFETLRKINEKLEGKYPINVTQASIDEEFAKYAPEPNTSWVHVASGSKASVKKVNDGMVYFGDNKDSLDILSVAKFVELYDPEVK